MPVALYLDRSKHSTISVQPVGRMPMRFQPKSLSTFALDRIVRCLVNACFEVNMRNTVMTQPELIARARSLLRPYWCSGKLPSSLRREILDKCLELLDRLIPESYLTCRAQSYAPAYILNILLDTDIRELKVQLCCYYDCDHKNTLLNVLATGYAKGLSSLELIRSKVSYFDPQLFRPIMLSLNDNLTNLGLRNISNDEMLKIIGQSCNRLVALDVSVSPLVSDDGMRDLLQYPIDDSRRLSTKPKHVRHMFFSETTVNLYPGKTETIDAATLREYCRYPTALCSTLRTLDVSSTNVTRFGILRALLTVDNLTSFSEHTHVGNAIDLYGKCTITSVALPLTAVKSCRTTADKLRTVCAVCTKLESIVVNGPAFPGSALRALPDTLTKLCLRGVPAEREWLDGLCEYLSASRSRNLRELSLRFDDRRGPLTVDLGVFLHRLTRLRVLAVHGVESALGPGRPAAALRNLDSACLGRVDHPDSLRRLLQCAPNLNALHVFACAGLDARNVVGTITGARNSRLTCFYVDELPGGGGDAHAVSNIANVYPDSISIGNVNNWNVSVLDEGLVSVWLFVNNAHLKFPGNFHWFFSTCFPDCRVFL